MRKKIVLVTGASGRVASLLRPWLVPKAELDIRWQSSVDNTGLAGWYRCEMNDGDKLAALARGCDAVLHLAGVTPHQPNPDYSANARLAIRAFAAASRARVPVFFAASSAAVYGTGPVPFHEGDACKPDTDYGRANVAAENQLVQASEGAPTRLCLLRIGNLAGADALMQGQPRPTVIDQYPHGATPVRSYVAAQTLARVLRDLTQIAPQHLPQTLNVAAPRPVEMAALMQAAGLAWSPRPQGYTLRRRIVMSTELLESLVEIRPEDASPDLLVGDVKRQMELFA